MEELYKSRFFIRSRSGTDKVYELTNFKDFSGVRLKFGDDIFGKKLNNGDSCFSNLLRRWIKGNVYSQNSITTVKVQLFMMKKI